ncbi:MAG TPA: DUF3830 family protein [Dongiaceae bacterium]|jgi:hypothetical protein|nr:DUF3830 family protein [Dongiaceae bacterium]
MSKQIYLSFPGRNAHGIIDLYWDNAPVTCESIWQGLAQPLQIKPMHSMFVGPEIAMVVPQDRRSFGGDKIPPESQSSYPLAGELLWVYQPAYARKGAADALWEIGMFYDFGGRLFGPTGWFAANVFGRMTKGLDEIAAACRSLRTEGQQPIELGRVKA